MTPSNEAEIEGILHSILHALFDLPGPYLSRWDSDYSLNQRIYGDIQVACEHKKLTPDTGALLVFISTTTPDMTRYAEFMDQAQGVHTMEASRGKHLVVVERSLGTLKWHAWHEALSTFKARLVIPSLRLSMTSTSTGCIDIYTP